MANTSWVNEDTPGLQGELTSSEMAFHINTTWLWHQATFLCCCHNSMGEYAETKIETLKLSILLQVADDIKILKKRFKQALIMNIHIVI